METLITPEQIAMVTQNPMTAVVMVLLFVGSMLKAWDKIDNRLIAPILTVVSIGLVIMINLLPVIAGYITTGILLSWVATGGYSQMKNIAQAKK